tara:strand:+ start:1958 stop:2545 length:588 start_codon:yes stop_codon:yes gene_type:complete
MFWNPPVTVTRYDPSNVQHRAYRGVATRIARLPEVALNVTYQVPVAFVVYDNRLAAMLFDNRDYLQEESGDLGNDLWVFYSFDTVVNPRLTGFLRFAVFRALVHYAIAEHSNLELEYGVPIPYRLQVTHPFAERLLQSLGFCVYTDAVQEHELATVHEFGSAERIAEKEAVVLMDATNSPRFTGPRADPTARCIK